MPESLAKTSSQIKMMDDVGVRTLLKFKVILQRGDLFILALYKLTRLYKEPLICYKVRFDPFFFLSVRNMSRQACYRITVNDLKRTDEAY